MKSRSFIVLTILTIFLFSTLFADATTTKSPFNNKTYTHSSLNKGEVIYNGIDVSTWQEQIDWKKVKDSKKVDFAFIRMGYRGSKNGKLYRDSWFKRNMEGAAANKIPVGVYFYTTAINKDEAKEEANYLIKNVKEYDVDLPLVIDFELTDGYRNTKQLKKSGKKTYNTELVSAFCKTVKDAGYKPMVYANKFDFEDYLYPKELTKKGYYLWLAQYNNKPTLGQKGKNTIKIDCWQYESSDTSVSGVKGNVDSNFFYDDGEFFASKVRELKKKSCKTDSITIKWNNCVGASSYNIYRSSSYGGKYKKIGESTSTSFTDSGLEEGREYYYKVSVDTSSQNASDKLEAYTDCNISRIVKTKSALNMRVHAGTGYSKIMTIPKGDVATVAASTTDGENKTWYKVKYNNKTGYVNGNYCTLYNVMKTSDETNSDEISLYKEADKSSEKLGTVEKGKLVRLSSTDETEGMLKVTVSFGESNKTGWIDSDVLVKSDTYTPLTKVTGIKRSSFKNDSITVAWNNVTGADKYAVYRAKAYNGKYTRQGYTSKTSLKDTGLTNGTAYYYRVYPMNQFETGPVSDKLETYTNNDVSRVIKTKSALSLRVHAGKSYSRIMTIPKDDAATVVASTVDGGNQKWYRVKYKNKTGYVKGSYCTLYTVMKTSKKAYLYSEADTSSKKIDTVAKDKLVRIRSTNKAANMCKVTVGYGVSNKTGWVSRDILVKSGTYKSLTKVKGLKRSKFGKSFISIKWNKVTGADKYAVYRSKAYNGKYKLLFSTSKTSFKNTSVVKGTTYYYRVYPVNQFNKGPASDTLTAWTKMGTSKKGVTKLSVPLRLHAGSQFTKLKTIPKNCNLTISSYTSDSKGNRWYKVTYKKKTGYVLGKRIRLK